jgi:hypothetical protein
LNYFNYFTEIEETFVRRRGKHLLLSPLDWALIEDWQERGMPLHVVIRGIESVFDVFDKQPPGTRTIKSLFYCREEIEAQHKEWLAAQVGGNGNSSDSGKADENSAFSPHAIAAHLTSVGEGLKKARSRSTGDLETALERVLTRLDELMFNAEGTEKLEGSLENLDSVIDDALRKSVDAGTLKKEVAAQLATYRSQMDKESYQRTFDLMLIKRLREASGIPRLSLFFL